MWRGSSERRIKVAARVLWATLLLFPLWAGAQGKGELPERFPDSTAAAEYLTDWLADQRKRGYWEASVDSLYRSDSLGGVVARVHTGNRYRWTDLRPPAEPAARTWLRRAGYRQRRYARGRTFSYREWTGLRDSTLVRAANAGYPFASVQLDSIEWRGEGQLSAAIAVTPGPLIRIGELRIPDGVRIREIFLNRYLELTEGEAYNQRALRRAGGRLRQLPYLQVTGEPKVTFLDSLAFVDFPLRRRSASRFDFVIGILPGGSADGSLLLTGELNGELYNGFGQGERLALRFEQLRPQTQELEVAAEYPYLFGLPLGVEGSLDLYRRDSSFLNVNYRVAVTYLRSGNDRFSAFIDRRVSIIPGGEPRQPTGSTADTLGLNRSFFGLQFRRNRTDRRFSPRNGYRLSLSVAGGTRRFRNAVTEGEEGDPNSGQFETTALAEYYFQPLRGTAFMTRLWGAALFSDAPLAVNEQYRIGGARLLRGFNEQQIFAGRYAILTGEFRLLLGEQAFLYLFGDYAYVDGRSRARPTVAPDYPLGLGAGVNFDTRAGIFSLSLALGRRAGEPLDIGAPKVHLGYLSVF